MSAGKWRGPTREYDLVKEFVAALTVVSLLTVLLAVLFSSPDEKNLTLQTWAAANPNDFVATAAAELAGTSPSATYGPPYNNAGDGQVVGPLALEKWAGVRINIDPANDFVTHPLSTLNTNADVKTALAAWVAASPDQQTKWATDYADALAPDGPSGGDPAKVATGDYGPVPAMATALLGMAASGELDSELVDTTAGFFQTDYTRPMLFLADGAYFDDAAGVAHLHGDQWGMMNETGSFPGQAWLWLCSFWYQIPPFAVEGNVWGDNADAIILSLMMVLTLILMLVPYIPGLRDIPKWIPIHRLIWRDYYAKVAADNAKV